MRELAQNERLLARTLLDIIKAARPSGNQTVKLEEKVLWCASIALDEFLQTDVDAGVTRCMVDNFMRAKREDRQAAR